MTSYATPNDGTWNYSYDAEGRLISAWNLDAATVSYSYDHIGRRISKTVNGTTTKYKYDGWNVTREMNSDESQTLAEYTYDSSGKPLSMRRNNATYYYTYNARGDITALVDSNGAVTNSYSYNPWGKHITESENVTNPYRYASYRYDSETGLYYLQNRYYSPDLMRFITRDLIRDIPGEASYSNYYLYAKANPIKNTDPNGLYVYKTYYRYKYRHGRWYTSVIFEIAKRIVSIKGSQYFGWQGMVSFWILSTYIKLMKRQVWISYGHVTYRAKDYKSKWHFYCSGWGSWYRTWAQNRWDISILKRFFSRRR